VPTYPGIHVISHALLPCQVPGGANSEGSPERRLLAAMMERAVLDAQAPPSVLHDRAQRRKQNAHTEAARAWIAGGEARLPFQYVCEALGLDADAVAQAVLGEVAA
jgi:hypothetical protein